MQKRVKKRREIGRSGRSSESRLAKVLGARLTPASGAMQGAKGDIMLKDFLIEAKSTLRDSFSVQLSQLAKIRAEALSAGKSPMLSVSFCTGNGAPRESGEWAMIPLRVWRELTGQ